jgi:DNA-directed RNA polymerase specialized sigma24 family protein
MQLSLSALYTDHRRELIAHAVQCGCDHYSAEDVVQDLFINLHKYDGASKIDGHKNPVAWLKQKLRWMVLKHRSKAKLPCRGGGVPHVEVSEAYNLTDTAETPDTRLNVKDTMAVLEACGCTEETVIWKPDLSRAKSMALYRFRKAVAPKLKKLLSC